jgi:hypothetical protein
MSVNVTDRPMTGQGVMGMKTAGSGGRLVEDSAHYVGLLSKRIRDVTQETSRLRTEIEEQSKNSSQTVQLERKYETLLKNKEALEGQLADYNLAMDKVRRHLASPHRTACHDMLCDVMISLLFLERLILIFARKLRRVDLAQTMPKVACARPLVRLLY